MEDVSAVKMEEIQNLGVTTRETEKALPKDQQYPVQLIRSKPSFVSTTPTDSIAEQLDELDEFRSQYFAPSGFDFILYWMVIASCVLVSSPKGDRELRFCSY